MKLLLKRKIALVIGMTLLGLNYSHAQNLLNMDGWTIGQGSTGVFGRNGTEIENIREWGEGPNGKRVILWKSQPDGLANEDGGWNTNPIAIDHTKMYRFTVWMKKTNSTNGVSYFGCDYVADLDNSPHANPYFWNGKLPELNKWYLLVGYIHGSGDDTQVHMGGIYDGVTGIKVLNCTDFKFFVGTTSTYHRTYLYYDPNVNDRQYFYAPRVDVVNGNEPSVESLLGIPGAGSGNAYFAGKVGIQTPNPGNYELAVNGKIRAKEVKVEAGWSDFVFEKGYPLLPLPEVESFIEKNKHLPDVPSDAEVKKNGVNLGVVHSKLLQKIEELTLYIIELNKTVQQQQKEINHLKKK
ncbi:hypothetical protein B0O44_104357 [Pedobacter nutrimenti]|uniref:Uncharacterized protein n=1 Tax=Pedobacter nutrimenti TaxID=1241337 RepID=A0A318UCR6_9SPHI|nr:hypothetical protein B0O44_104357 [Pedobacter nutrimenti]